jgi:hypothetical protein
VDPHRRVLGRWGLQSRVRDSETLLESFGGGDDSWQGSSGDKE